MGGPLPDGVFELYCACTGKEVSQVVVNFNAGETLSPAPRECIHLLSHACVHMHTTQINTGKAESKALWPTAGEHMDKSTTGDDDFRERISGASTPTCTWSLSTVSIEEGSTQL